MSWDKNEERDLKQYISDNKSIEEISDLMNRSESSIKSKIYRLKQAKYKECINCGIVWLIDSYNKKTCPACNKDPEIIVSTFKINTDNKFEDNYFEE